MINTSKSNLYKIFYGEKPIKIGYYDKSLIHANGLLLSFNWKYIKNFTVNGVEYEYPAAGIVFPKKTNVKWSATPLNYCHLDITEGEFVMEDHTTIGSNGYIDSLPLNVVFHHKKTTNILYTKELYDGIEENYSPIGIEVIPSTHDVYGNFMSGVASLEVLQGCFDDNDNEWGWATQRNQVGYNTNMNASTTSFSGSNGDVFLPTNANEMLETYPGQCKEAVVEGEYYLIDSSNRYAPSPYDQNGNQNPLYIKNANSNCLQYFDGKSQTSNIYAHVGDKATAVKKTLEYSTIGTKPGDWYIPSTGEFGYVVAKWQYYLDIAGILRSIYPYLNLGARTGSFFTSNYWGFRNAATGYQMTRFSMNRGYHTKSSKTEINNVIPFCMIPDSNIKTLTLDWCGVESYKINGVVYDDRMDASPIVFSIGTKISWSATPLSDNYTGGTWQGEFVINEDMVLSTNPTVTKTEMGVVVINKRTQEIFYTDYFFTYPKEVFEPIGIVVIPKSHDVYGDGSVGVIGLKLINVSTPDIGGTERTSIPFGGMGASIADKNMNRVNVYEDDSQSSVASIVNTSSSTSEWAYMPVQTPFDQYWIECLCDSHCGYTDSAVSRKFIPSPYLQDGSRNPDYYTLSTSTYNLLGYFDGREKTREVLKFATTQPAWKTDPTILMNTDAGSYPAACACWRYHTEGTKQGDWYIPSTGETGYVAARRMWIGYTLETIKHFFEMDINIWVDSFSTCDQISTEQNIVVGFKTGRCNAVNNDKLDTLNAPFTHMRILEMGEF